MLFFVQFIQQIGDNIHFPMTNLTLKRRHCFATILLSIWVIRDGLIPRQRRLIVLCCLTQRLIINLAHWCLLYGSALRCTKKKTLAYDS